jgi:EEF1A N-terminal glycine/lysine methyltransferase
MSTFDTDLEESLDLFADPPGYYVPPAEPTTETYTLLSGSALSLRLVGHNPLWGHYLWNAGRLIAAYLETHVSLVQSKTVLELGAGSGLPSLVCAIIGAKQVVVTDYPDPELIENIRYNIEHCQQLTSHEQTEIKNRMAAEGFIWGGDPAPLLAHIASAAPGSATNPVGFDTLILADLLFNYSEHTKLVSTIKQTLSREGSAKALVFFTPYRPWLLENDLKFFDIAREEGFVVEKVLEEKMERAMFKADRGSEDLRRTVFGFVLTWNEVNMQAKDN